MTNASIGFVKSAGSSIHGLNASWNDCWTWSTIPREIECHAWSSMARPGWARPGSFKSFCDNRSHFDRKLGRTRVPVVSIQMPPAPSERDLYEEILNGMNGVFAQATSVTTLRHRIRALAPARSQDAGHRRDPFTARRIVSRAADHPERDSLSRQCRSDNRFMSANIGTVYRGVGERCAARPAGSNWLQLRGIEGERIALAANGAAELQWNTVNASTMERASRHWPATLQRRFASALRIRTRKRWPYNRFRYFTVCPGFKRSEAMIVRDLTAVNPP